MRRNEGFNLEMKEFCKKICVISCLFCLGVGFGCKKEEAMNFQLDSEIESAVQRVSKGRVYFGHQSVGDNILDGMERIGRKFSGDEIKIYEIGKDNRLAGGFLVHGKIGENGSPKSKCEAVKNILRSGLGDKLDVVLFKFCFIDIREKDDEREMLDLYRVTLASLKSEYPKVKFVPITVPLTVNEKEWKYIIKKIIRKETERDNNVKRNEFNRLLRECFKDESVFDLAEIESKRPNGGREVFRIGEKRHYSLAQEYSSDGSHLNDYGSQMVAKELILFLGRLLAEKE